MSLLRIVGKILLALIGLVVTYLIVVIFGPGFEVARQPLPGSRSAGKKKGPPSGSRQDVTFEVAGDAIRAWLYLPQDIPKAVPCVVLNHGFGGTKDHLLERYALRFQAAGMGFFLRLFVHAQRDKGRSRFGLSAHKIPIVGEPGTLAMIVAPGAFEGYAQLFSSDFVNEVCARALLMTGGYNPIDHAPDVECPVLLQLCEHDNLVSPKSAANTAGILDDLAQLERYPISHFDIYHGEHFQRALNDQIEFLSKHLGLTTT